MHDHVYKIIELVGSSETSIEDAINTEHDSNSLGRHTEHRQHTDEEWNRPAGHTGRANGRQHGHDYHGDLLTETEGQTENLR